MSGSGLVSQSSSRVGAASTRYGGIVASRLALRSRHFQAMSVSAGGVPVPGRRVPVRRPARPRRRGDRRRRHVDARRPLEHQALRVPGRGGGRADGPRGGRRRRVGVVGECRRRPDRSGRKVPRVNWHQSMDPQWMAGIRAGWCAACNAHAAALTRCVGPSRDQVQAGQRFSRTCATANALSSSACPRRARAGRPAPSPGTAPARRVCAIAGRAAGSAAPTGSRSTSCAPTCSSRIARASASRSTSSIAVSQSVAQPPVDLEPAVLELADARDRRAEPVIVLDGHEHRPVAVAGPVRSATPTRPRQQVLDAPGGSTCRRGH